VEPKNSFEEGIIMEGGTSTMMTNTENNQSFNNLQNTVIIQNLSPTGNHSNEIRDNLDLLEDIESIEKQFALD